MIIRVTMKDGQIHRYDGVISITKNHFKLFITYYSESSFLTAEELNLTEVKSFHYGE